MRHNSGITIQEYEWPAPDIHAIPASRLYPRAIASRSQQSRRPRNPDASSPQAASGNPSTAHDPQGDSPGRNAPPAWLHPDKPDFQYDDTTKSARTKPRPSLVTKQIRLHTPDLLFLAQVDLSRDRTQRYDRLSRQGE